MGRPLKFSAEVEAATLAGIRAGLALGHAAEAAGVSRQSFLAWRQAGERAGRGRFHHFLVKVRQARAEAVREMVGLVVQAAQSGDVASARCGLSGRSPGSLRSASKRRLGLPSGTPLELAGLHFGTEPGSVYDQLLNLWAGQLLAPPDIGDRSSPCPSSPRKGRAA